MKQTVKPVLIILMLLVSAQVNAIEPIKVLFAKTAGVSDTDALSMLGQINLLMNNSGLSSRQFVNANTPSFVKLASTCAGSNYLILLGCAEDELEATRIQHNADIVLMLVPTLGSICGGTPPGLVNTFFVLSTQRHFGYAVVSNQCMLTNGLYPASHEVLHLLYTEHKSNDPHTDRPFGARDNHAATQLNFATAGAVPSDCQPNYSCSNFQNFMSEDGKNFSNGFPAGNSLHSNVKNFVPNTSWGVVAAYLPIPAPTPTCNSTNIRVTALPCNNYNNRTFLVTGNLPGYQITRARYEVKVGYYGIWQIILDGILSCPLFNSGFGFYVKMFFTTPQGTAVCQKYVSFPSCGGGGDPPIQPW